MHMRFFQYLAVREKILDAQGYMEHLIEIHI